MAPSALRATCEDLARGLSLTQEEGLKVVLAQPALLELRPPTVRALSRRIADELRVRSRTALMILAGLPPEELSGLLGGPPGLIRERAKGLRRLLKQTFGPRRATPAAALLLAYRCPALLALPTKAVGETLAALMAIPPTKGTLAPPRGPAPGGGAGGNTAAASSSGRNVGAGAGGRSMLDAIIACPHILALPPETLRARFVALAAAARIDMPAVVSMLLLQPRLLLAEPARVRQRLEGLTFSLMVPRRAALDMVVRQPQLLLYQTETLADTWAALQGLLSVTFETVLSMVTRCEAGEDEGPSVGRALAKGEGNPNLLCMSASKLASKLAALEAAFSISHPRAVLLAAQHPALLTIAEKRFQRKHRLLSSLVHGLDTPALGRLVCREPYLLLLDGAKLAAKVKEAAAALATTEAQIGDMISRSPRFIARDPSRWQANLGAMVEGFGVTREQACAAACRYPGLLVADPEELASSVSRTMALLRTSPAWLAQLASGDPELLFKCAQGYNSRTYAHLQFLVESRLQSSQAFASPIIWDRASFLQRYPQFAEWQRRRADAATAPNGVPWRRAEQRWGGAVERGGRAAADPTGTEPVDSQDVSAPQPLAAAAASVSGLPYQSQANGDGASAFEVVEARSPAGAKTPLAGGAVDSGSESDVGSEGSGVRRADGGKQVRSRQRTGQSRRKRMVVFPSISSADE
ncbi:hypothetical protein GPECTOR_10g919 [Gonium pectorale]|uniref:Uncharacterized protein n=1 Tax=Gonium pectorale TaxID=33097 RepID=A0A150GR55_GONPE|nr:hypothetical protein GPECTOR_10g919 [Gonium pectorale]|eukprot:KXZ52287.1 hypothetical protein GPECTOR_10g919 [Gonium pectorale]